jgi:hypothetical protein
MLKVIKHAVTCPIQNSQNGEQLAKLSVTLPSYGGLSP